MRKTLWTSFLLTMMICSLAFALFSRQAITARAAENAVMVWDARCLNDIHKDQNTKLYAPLKDDGTPDMKRSYIRGLHASYQPGCGHIEVQK